MNNWLPQVERAEARRRMVEVEGKFKDLEDGREIPFSIRIRMGWLSLETIQSRLFDKVYQSFSTKLGEPEEPPSCSGNSECQDDSVYLTTSWRPRDGALDDLSGFMKDLLGVEVSI